MVRYLLLLILILPLTASAWFGDSTSMTSNNCGVEDSICGSYYVADSTGQIDSAIARILDYAVTKKWKLLIFKASDKSLVGVSDEVSVTASALVKRQKFTFSTRPSVVMGTSYALAAWCEAGLTLGTVRDVESAGDSTVRQNLTYGDPPNPFAPVAELKIADKRVVIWAYVTVSIGTHGICYKPGQAPIRYKPGWNLRHY